MIPALPLRPAFRRVAKAIVDVQFGVQRKQQRQTRGLAGVDVLVDARVPPGAAQARVILPVSAEYHGRGVVHEAAERLVAESLVVPRVQD